MQRRELLKRACLSAAAVKLTAAGVTTTAFSGCHAGRALSTNAAATALSSASAAASQGDGASLASPRGSADGMADPSKPIDWSEVRAQFLLDPAVVHLGSLLLSSHPRSVREAIQRHRDGLDRNPVQYWRENNVRLRSEARAAAATYWGVDSEDVALTESTTHGLATLYNGLHLQPGDEIVSTPHDHPATRRSLAYKAERSGAELRIVTLYDGPEVSETSLVQPLLDAVTDRTRVMAVTWVHSGTGVKLPVRALAAGLAEVNASRDPADQVLLCVDGVHGFGIEDEDMKSLGADFLSAGCHKWVFGPRGTGALFAARTEVWNRVSPTIPSFGPLHTPGGAMSPGGFQAFEHRWALPEAFAFITAIGRRPIAERSHALARQFKEGLRAIPKARLHTPLDSQLSAAIVCFEMRGLKTAALVERLWERGIVITESPYESRYARVTPSILNTPEDVEAALRALREL